MLTIEEWMQVTGDNRFFNGQKKIPKLKKKKTEPNIKKMKINFFFIVK